MEILSKFPQSRFMSIGWVRLFLLVGIILLIGATCLGVLLLRQSAPFGTILAILLNVLILLAFCCKLFMMNIVYLAKNEIKLVSVLKTVSYPVSEFKAIGAYVKFLELLYIEFTDGKRYHIMIREMHANNINSLINNPASTIFYLTQKIKEFH